MGAEVTLASLAFPKLNFDNVEIYQPHRLEES